jgi:DNA-binding response OmpR family regulator
MEIHRKKIVYIEDEPAMIKLLQFILRREDVELIGAVDGLQGLEAIRETRPDLVILDLMLPEIDGWEIYRRIRDDEQTKDIPVIVLTVRASRRDKILGEQVYKVNGYMTKPFDIEELLQRVRRALGAAAVSPIAEAV